MLFHLANKVALNIAFFHGFPPFGTVEHSRVYVAQTGGLESFIFLYYGGMYLAPPEHVKQIVRGPSASGD